MRLLLPAFIALLSAISPRRRGTFDLTENLRHTSLAASDSPHHPPARRPSRWLPTAPSHRRGRNSSAGAGDDEISPYYRRDRREVVSGCSHPSNATGLRRLLGQRYEARRRFVSFRRASVDGDGDSKAADAAAEDVAIVDRQLWEWHGVTAFDSPPIWTTISRSDNPPEGQRRKREERWTRRLVELYGSLGHPYRPEEGGPAVELDPLFCALDAPTVHRLLSRRERLRLEGRYEEADAAKLELWIQGIRVSDDARQWSLARSRSRRECETPDDHLTPDVGERQQHDCRYTEDKGRSAGFPNDDPNDNGGGSGSSRQSNLHRRVEQLLGHRSQALARGDVRTSLHLELELHRTYRVRVDDDQRVWWVAKAAASYSSSERRLDAKLVEAIRQRAMDEDAAAKPVVPVVMLPRGEPTTAEMEEYRWSSASKHLEHEEAFLSRVESLVRQRAWKREAGKFLEADAIRRELWCTYSVGITDRLRQYSVGGVFDDSD